MYEGCYTVQELALALLRLPADQQNHIVVYSDDMRMRGIPKLPDEFGSVPLKLILVDCMQYEQPCDELINVTQVLCLEN